MCELASNLKEIRCGITGVTAPSGHLAEMFPKRIEDKPHVVNQRMPIARR